MHSHFFAVRFTRAQTKWMKMRRRQLCLIVGHSTPTSRASLVSTNVLKAYVPTFNVSYMMGGGKTYVFLFHSSSMRPVLICSFLFFYEMSPPSCLQQILVLTVFTLVWSWCLVSAATQVFIFGWNCKNKACFNQPCPESEGRAWWDVQFLQLMGFSSHFEVMFCVNVLETITYCCIASWTFSLYRNSLYPMGLMS